VSGTHLEHIFVFCVIIAGFFLRLTTGRVFNLLKQLLLVLARTVTLGSKSCRTNDHILSSHLRLPQPGGPGPRIYISQEQGGPIYPPLRTLGPLSIASYDLEGYGDVILTRLHTGQKSSFHICPVINWFQCLRKHNPSNPVSIFFYFSSEKNYSSVSLKGKT
jgi:hypothetical protein